MEKRRSKVSKKNAIPKTDIVSPLFNVEQMKKTIATGLQIYINQKPVIEKMVQIQAPLIADMVKKANVMAKLYHSAFINSGVIDQMVRMQQERKELEKSLKNIFEPPRLITYAPRPANKRVINEYRLSPEATSRIAKETAEIIFQKMKDSEKTDKSQMEDKIIHLPKGATWQSVTIAVCKDDQKLEIYYKNELAGKINYAKLGLIMGNTKDGSLNQTGEFLEKLSLFYMKNDQGHDYSHEATVEKLMHSLKIAKKQLLHNVKLDLARKLRKIIDSDPFEDYKKCGCYKPKFILEPESLLRNDGEIRLQSSSIEFNENFEQDAEQNQWRSDNTENGY